ncbi:hypothetical protein J6590_052827 [Homalodisca vitripennis]|nr:hypothetical protein J6590_052827 [Homalodisca vitripennis]
MFVNYRSVSISSVVSPASGFIRILATSHCTFRHSEQSCFENVETWQGQQLQCFEGFSTRLFEIQISDYSYRSLLQLEHFRRPGVLRWHPTIPLSSGRKDDSNIVIVNVNVLSLCRSPPLPLTTPVSAEFSYNALVGYFKRQLESAGEDEAEAEEVTVALEVMELDVDVEGRWIKYIITLVTVIYRVTESAGEDEAEAEEVAVALEAMELDVDVEGGCLVPGERPLNMHRPSTCLATEKPKPLAKNVKPGPNHNRAISAVPTTVHSPPPHSGLEASHLGDWSIVLVCDKTCEIKVSGH